MNKLLHTSETELKKLLCEKYLKQMDEGIMGPWEARWCLEDMKGMRYTVSKEITALATDVIYKLMDYAKNKKYLEDDIDFETFCNKGLVLLIKK